MSALTGQQIAAEALEGWANLIGGLQTRIHTLDFATGVRLVNLVAAAAAELGLQPDLDLRPTQVDVRLADPEVRGVTETDVRLARAILALAEDEELVLECEGVSRLELALDTPAFATVLPFWGAVLGLEHRHGPDFGDELRDRHGALPTVWFQESGEAEPRQRWHPDVWVDPAEVRPRIDAALAAGGTLVSDDEAPAFWVLADPEGNRMCLCTWQGRD